MNGRSHMKHFIRFVCVLLTLSISMQQPAAAEEQIIKAGIVGCDTSHVIAFTDLINAPSAIGEFAKVEVTHAFPGGSDDIPSSRDRLPTFVSQLRERGIKIVDTIEALAEECDAVLLESVDGRVHWEQFRAVARGKPVFIDKPAAASLADVITIFRHAEKTSTPCFSSSALRYCESVAALASDASAAPILGCDTAGPMMAEPHHPDLFWYGVHGVESLYAVMGTGCATVTRVDADPSTVVVGTWGDGRIGSFRGLKQGKADYSFTLYGNDRIVHREGFSGYEPLAREICKFFLTGKEPVSREETIEIFAFMEAADESKRLGGRPVSLREIIARAEQATHAEKN